MPCVYWIIYASNFLVTLLTLRVVWVLIYYRTVSSVDFGKKYDFSPRDLRRYKTKIRKDPPLKKVDDLDLLRQNLCIIIVNQKYQKNSLKAL
jgi:hypothetical protein